jgi:hypothetical protein
MIIVTLLQGTWDPNQQPIVFCPVVHVKGTRAAASVDLPYNFAHRSIALA